MPKRTNETKMVAVCIDTMGLAPTNSAVPKKKSYIDHYMKKRFVIQYNKIHCGR
jgi:hypothetical protein